MAEAIRSRGEQKTKKPIKPRKPEKKKSSRTENNHLNWKD